VTDSDSSLESGCSADVEWCGAEVPEMFELAQDAVKLREVYREVDLRKILEMR
jgi:hypothetical protein